jgi:putative CocE/NonD family hydrolase
MSIHWPICVAAGLLLLPQSAVRADIPENPAQYVRQHYTKKNYQIPMRDGAQLFTIVYTPRDQTQAYPLLMTRTPYGIHPYEEDKFRASLGPNPHFIQEKYIFVYQDVRGRFMSQGTYENVRPQLRKHAGPADVDESTDTYDTIEWLLKHVPGHNGKVGLSGISYPGFYSAAGMIDAHPALAAVSPQAPIADWFFDDFFHHGAFFLPHAFDFFSGNMQPRPVPTSTRNKRFDYPTTDGYAFYLDIGPLKNVNSKYFHHRVAYWDTMMQHPNYDAFWQARNLLPHLRNVAPAVMTVGGWFDAEDLYGALNTYQTVEKQNPKIFNVLVMGAWSHGGWSREESTLGALNFGSNTSAYFQREIELPFFNHFLKGQGENHLAEATMFETGANRWRRFDQWPPRQLEKKAFYLHERGRLSVELPQEEGNIHDSFPSNPDRPVPYTTRTGTRMAKDYMAEDQRFASRRPDVLVYQTGALPRELTLAGPLKAELFVTTTGTDADWIVKLIDVEPDGQQVLIRSEVLRGRFRNSYEKPEPFVPDQPAKISLVLQDVLHTFGTNHRIMVHVCSTWFPLVDRNPQKFVPNIFLADEADFITTTHKVFRSSKYPSNLQVGVLPAEK